VGLHCISQHLHVSPKVNTLSIRKDLNAARLWSGFGLFLIRIFFLGRSIVLIALRQRVIGDVANNNQNKKADYSLWQRVGEMR
jgi:hypothetical protein